MKSFELTGEGIEVRFNVDGVLSARIEERQDPNDGTRWRGYDEEIPAENLVISTSELGTMLTGILVKTFRDGSQARLYVLVPSQIRTLDEAPITGAAIIVLDRAGKMGHAPLPLQQFDVRQLSGTLRD